MRVSFWMLIAAIVLALFAFVVGVFGPNAVVPPGQYPLTDRPAFWPSTPSVGLYHPRHLSGENTIAPSFIKDAKLSCALART